MNIETIYKVWCPKCDKHCYVNNGDTNDCSGSDVEGIKCPYCEHCFPLGEGYEDEIEPHYTLGEKTLD